MIGNADVVNEIVSLIPAINFISSSPGTIGLFETTIRYVGHAQGFDPPTIEGSLENKDAAIRYRRGGRTLAVATIGRDIEALKAELDLEREPAG